MCHSFAVMVFKQRFTDVESCAGSDWGLKAVCLEKCGVAEHQSFQNDSLVNQRHSNVFEYTARTGDDCFFSPLFLQGESPPLHHLQQPPTATSSSSSFFFLPESHHTHVATCIPITLIRARFVAEEGGW